MYTTKTGRTFLDSINQKYLNIKSITENIPPDKLYLIFSINIPPFFFFFLNPENQFLEENIHPSIYLEKYELLKRNYYLILFRILFTIR